MTCTHAATEVADACIENCPICQRGEIERLDAELAQTNEAHGVLVEENGRLRAALKPFAGIPLWRDTYPDAKHDSIGIVTPITVEMILAARVILDHQQLGENK